MPVRIVQSQQNARLKQLRRALAQPGRDEALAGIEGPIMLREAVRAGLRIEAVFAAQEAESLLAGLELPAQTEVLLAPRALLSRALATETPQPVAALVEPPRWSWDDLLARAAAPLVVVLAGLQDPGNLGTILRSAEAFDAQGIISLPGTVSVWNPKTVRASAGSVFRVPLMEVTADEAFVRLKQAGMRTLATAVRGAESATQTNLAQAVALFIGNEGNGLADDLAARTDAAITIPCPGPVESLNAAVATSVLLYEASRQRAASKAQEGTR